MIHDTYISRGYREMWPESWLMLVLYVLKEGQNVTLLPVEGRGVRLR